MKIAAALFLLLPALLLADTHPTNDHEIHLSASELEAGAKLINDRLNDERFLYSFGEAFLLDIETRLDLNVYVFVTYDPEIEMISFRNLFLGTPMENTESGCRNIIALMKKFVPKMIASTFIPGDDESHSPEEFQRAVLDRTETICLISEVGKDEEIRMRHSFANGSELASDGPDTDD